MNHAVIAWGRFNPPTEEGHGKLVSAVQAHAEKVGGQHYVFPTHTEDKKKNPLSHSDKVSALRSLFPNANVVSNSKVRTIIDAMKHLEGKGHKEVTVVAGSDRVPEYHKLLNSYREKEFPKIKKVNVVSAGQRDPDAEGAEGMSASKLRGLVAAGKRNEFISHYSDPKLGAQIHDKVKAGMQTESVSPLAIFLLGGPGSGKDYVLNNVFSRFDLTEVQADHLLSGAADELLRENKNIVVNGVGDLDKIQILSAMLENYEIDHVFVSVTNKVSRLRNSLREQPLAESKRIEKFLHAEKLSAELDCFIFNNSINLKESSELERLFFANQIEKLLERLVGHGLEIKEEAKLQSFVLIREKKFPAVRKKHGMPAKYSTGLSKSTALARKAHWKKMGKLSDRDPRAYEPAPGDATAKTKPSKHTLAVRKMMAKEEVQPVQEVIGAATKIANQLAKSAVKNLPKTDEVARLQAQQAIKYEKAIDKTVKAATVPVGGAGLASDQAEINKNRKPKPIVAAAKVQESADKSLAAKAKKSGVSLSTLRKVYRRGVAAWNSGHRPGTTPSQWGHARVNSYINKGKTYHTADKDLREEVENLDSLFEMQLVGTDEYRKHAIAMTPGQNQEIEDVTKTMGMDVSAKEDCGCPDESDCNCNESVSEGNRRTFRELRAEAKQASQVELPSTADVTPTLKKSKGSNKITTPGRLVNPAVDGLPVVSRLTGEAVDPAVEKIKKELKPLDAVGSSVRKGKTLGNIARVAKFAGKVGGGLLATTDAPDLYNLAKSTTKDIVDKATMYGMGPSKESKIRRWAYSKDMPNPVGKFIDKQLGLQEAVNYHLENKISFTENVFRPGSEMFFEMIKEAKRLYKEGAYEPKDEWEKDMLESNIGEVAEFEGQQVVLDYPIEEGLEECWEEYAQPNFPINEIFNTTYPHTPHGTVQWYGQDYHLYSFQVPPKNPEDKKMHTFSVTIGQRQGRDGEKMGEIAFSYNGKHSSNFTPIKPDGGIKFGKQDLTQKFAKGSLGVISTVMDIAKKHAQMHGLSSIEFAGDRKEPSRTKLYDRIAARHGGEIEDAGFQKTYNVPVTESSDPTDGKGIGKPWRENGGGAVYVRDGDSIRKIRFSQSGMKKKYMDPGATRSFVARHRCLTNKDKTSASYWACRWPRFFSNSGKVWW